MAQYLRVEFDCDYPESYLEWAKNLVVDDYKKGGFDGIKPIVSIRDDEDD